MLQLAQATATLANDGVKHKPQLVVATQDAMTRRKQSVLPAAPVDLGFKPENLAIVRNAMIGVTQDGTSARVFAGAAYRSGGKTGTAQAVGIAAKERYNASKMEEHQRDHALYVAFAPADDPKIVVAVMIEFGGHGTRSAHIASAIIEHYLKTSVKQLLSTEGN